MVTWSLEQAQQVIGYTFRRPDLLRTALTHRSYLNEHPEETEDYERLEFLGDAVLDLVVAEHLFYALPDWPEGDLTFLRATLVRTEQLADYARQLGLGDILRLGRGAELSGGRNHTAILADAFEAVVGALYLDGGLDVVRDWVLERFIAPTVEAARRSGRTRRDPKSRLQEAVQARYNITPRYAIIAESGPEHDRRFTAEVRIGDEVWGVGEGRSKQEATLAAAEAALRRLEEA
ncbi:hypothetical protein SE16_05745 [Ardenticatena maritima]|uniref:Ribonuclease 3 n=1 Tax=Ardenticatena maritima TaxID=872965 RepID=A0A0P6YD71_9CHLR|nr:hypothetical protein SE16_05745 [Ardenticatena maritima]